MNLNDIAKLTAKETGEPVLKVKKILNVAFKIIRQQIIKAQIIKIKNFMTMYIDVVQETQKYDMLTKRVITLPKRFILKLVPSVTLKKIISAKKTY